MSLAWTPAAGATGYRLYRSGVVLAVTTASSATWAHLNCGSTYRFSVQAYNKSGSSRRIDYYAASAACGSTDTAAPTTPSGLVASGATQAGLSLSWNKSTDNVGVVGYGVYVNGTKVGSSALPSYAVGGLTCATGYTLGVDAYDAAGNRSARVTVAGSTGACPSTPSPSPPPPPPSLGAAGLYLSPSGSDSSACTQAAPCRSFDRAYHVAGGGTAVFLASGDYGGQSLTYNAALVGASSPVVFQPAPGATPYLSGELSLRAAAGQPIANVEVDNMAIDDIYVRYVQHVTFRNIKLAYFFVRSSDHVSFIGGQATGDSVGVSNTIGAVSAGTAPSTNILVDGVSFHDFNTTQAPGAHVECLFIQESDTVTIRNSTFARCEDFDIYGNVILGGTIRNVTINNNHFGVTTPKGFYAFRANVGAYSFNNNTWDQGMSNDAPVAATGCGNTLSSSGLSMPSALLKPC